LEKYNSKKEFFGYVKDEGSNLNTMLIVLKIVVGCEVLGWSKVSKELVLIMHF
jgi:hypothetical protein